jgi:hypothetical protein
MNNTILNDLDEPRAELLWAAMPLDAAKKRAITHLTIVVSLLTVTDDWMHIDVRKGVWAHSLTVLTKLPDYVWDELVRSAEAVDSAKISFVMAEVARRREDR